MSGTDVWGSAPPLRIQRSIPLSCYACAVRSPVLTRLCCYHVLCDVRRCPVLTESILLPALNRTTSKRCPARSTLTDAPSRTAIAPWPLVDSFVPGNAGASYAVLGLCYAKCGTDVSCMEAGH
eukprot:2719377-Rhodomonas_salina.1